MSIYKSFAVVGAGNIGLPILNALAAKNVAVILLSRPGSAAKTVPSGVEVIQVDPSNATTVAAIFKEHKVDVVLTMTPGTVPEAQRPVVDAAKLAGVKLFVPSEYGLANEGAEGVLGGKNKIAGQNK
jgi:saccharopine dehydrogenase-like NADP-dependent oxidoreductase